MTGTSIDLRLRAADPAADLDRDPASATGQRVLARARSTEPPWLGPVRPGAAGRRRGGQVGLALANWVVTATVTEETVLPSGPSWVELRLDDIEVHSVTPTYFSLGEHPLPSLGDLGQAWGEVWAELTVKQREASYVGERVHLVLLGSGTPEELAAGRREDGARSVGVIMLLDRAWQVLEGGGGHGRQFAEVLALYGEPDLDALLRLLADARVAAEYSIRTGINAREGGWQTPGPLGEWRRANGWEHDAQAPSPEDQRLAMWLASDPATRPLPDVDDGELPLDQLAAALGTDALITWRVHLLGMDGFGERYPWVGLRLVDVGLYGIFWTAGQQTLDLAPLGPAGATAELVAWHESDGNAVDRACPDLVLPLTAQSPGVVTVDLRSAVDAQMLR